MTKANRNGPDPSMPASVGLRIGAGVLLLATIIVVLWSRPTTSSPPWRAPAGSSNVDSVTLSDGSTVRLWIVDSSSKRCWIVESISDRNDHQAAVEACGSGASTEWKLTRVLSVLVGEVPHADMDRVVIRSPSSRYSVSRSVYSRFFILADRILAKEDELILRGWISEGKPLGPETVVRVIG
jgi:hypothetical protein